MITISTTLLLEILAGAAVLFLCWCAFTRGGRCAIAGLIDMIAGLRHAGDPTPPAAVGGSLVSSFTAYRRGGITRYERVDPYVAQQLPAAPPQPQPVGNGGGQQQGQGGQQGQQGQQANPPVQPAAPAFNVNPGGNARQMVITFPGGVPQAQVVLVQWALTGTQNWVGTNLVPANPLTISNMAAGGQHDVRLAVIDPNGQMSAWSAVQQVQVA